VNSGTSNCAFRMFQKYQVKFASEKVDGTSPDITIGFAVEICTKVENWERWSRYHGTPTTSAIPANVMSPRRFRQPPRSSAISTMPITKDGYCTLVTSPIPTTSPAIPASPTRLKSSQASSSQIETATTAASAASIMNT
jgi:hypothetical protein